METDLLSSFDRVGVRARTSGTGFVLAQKIKPTLCNPQPRGLVDIIGGVAYLFLRLARILLVLFALRHGSAPKAAQMQPTRHTAQTAEKTRPTISKPTIVASLTLASHCQNFANSVVSQVTKRAGLTAGAFLLVALCVRGR